MDRRDFDPLTGRPDLDPAYRRDDDFGQRRSSSALWGLLIAAVVAVAAILFMYNAGDGDRTATTNNPAATTADRGNVPPAGAPVPRDTTGSSAPTTPPTSPMAR